MLAFPSSIPEDQRLMYSYTAYMDESGTHDGSESVVVAGFISLPPMWVEFSAKWQLALNDFGLDYFHMADFANHVGPYASWNEEERRLRLARLLTIVSENTLGSVATCVPLKPFQDIFSPRAKSICGDAYGLATVACFMYLAEHLRDQSLDGWVNYVLESGSRGAGQIANVFNANERDPSQKADLRLSSLRFENKRQFLPLQGADILAYELYKNWPRERAAREQIEHQKRIPRFPLVELAKAPHSWGRLDEQELRKFNRLLSLRGILEDQGRLRPL